MGSVLSGAHRGVEGDDCPLFSKWKKICDPIFLGASYEHGDVRLKEKISAKCGSWPLFCWLGPATAAAFWPMPVRLNVRVPVQGWLSTAPIEA